jgi:PPM family protein phosphatase
MTKDAIRNWLGSVAEERSVQVIHKSNIYLATDVGIARKENQDRVAALTAEPSGGGMPFCCVAVTDGMGGMLDGAECATSALASFFYSLVLGGNHPAPVRLKTATIDANEDVHGRWHGKGGTTLSAVLIEADGSVHTSNVGDSRIYAVGKGWSGIRRITVDDNLQDAFGGEGRELVQFIGVGKALLPRIDTLSRGFEGLLITSDGAHFFDSQVFEELAVRAGAPARAGERIIALSRWLGGPDNSTVAALRISDVVASLSSSSDLPTIWSGVRQLQFIPPNVSHFSAAASPDQPTSVSLEKTEHDLATTSKRKRKAQKQSSKEKQQLEINITTDESDDGSDS